MFRAGCSRLLTGSSNRWFVLGCDVPGWKTAESLCLFCFVLHTCNKRRFSYRLLYPCFADWCGRQMMFPLHDLDWFCRREVAYRWPPTQKNHENHITSDHRFYEYVECWCIFFLVLFALYLLSFFSSKLWVFIFFCGTPWGTSFGGPLGPEGREGRRLSRRPGGGAQRGGLGERQRPTNGQAVGGTILTAPRHQKMLNCFRWRALILFLVTSTKISERNLDLDCTMTYGFRFCGWSCDVSFPKMNDTIIKLYRFQSKHGFPIEDDCCAFNMQCVFRKPAWSTACIFSRASTARSANKTNTYWFRWLIILRCKESSGFLIHGATTSSWPWIFGWIFFFWKYQPCFPKHANIANILAYLGTGRSTTL